MMNFLPSNRIVATAAGLILATGGFSIAAETEFPAYEITADDIVRDQPAGELRIFERDGVDYRSYLGGVEEGMQTGMKLEVVFDEDGKTVWFHNLISTAQDCFVWTKGTLEDGIVTIPQGTPMWFADYGTHISAYILCNLKPSADIDNEGTYDAYECITGDIRFSYTDGVFHLLPNESGTATIGLQRYSTDSFIIDYGMNYKWLGYADADSSYKPFDEIPNEGPSENTEISKYTFTYKDNPDNPAQTHLVDVAIEGSNMYIRGIGAGLGDEYWAVAHIDGDKAVIPAKQYFGGIKEGYETYLTYLCAAKIVDQYYIDFAEETIFTYNADDKSYSTEGSMMFNVGDDRVIPAVFWTEMTLAPYEERPTTPANPTFVEDYTPDEYQEGAGSIIIEIPNEDTDGAYINPENMTYMIYIDGKPFTFDPSVYYGLMEPMTEIPYYFSDGWDISPVSNSMRRIMFYFDEPESIGVQSICTVGDVVNKSEIIYNTSVSVESAVTDMEPASIQCFNTAGTPVGEDYKGIIIRKVTYKDGTVKTFKSTNR